MSFVLRHPVRSKLDTLRRHKKISKKKTGVKVKPWDERNHQLHLPKKDHERLFHSRSFLLDEKENQNIFQDAPQIFERKRALIKERFYNQEKELREVLSETDRTMANVQDMFGDDVQRYRVFPHITRAPTKNTESLSFLKSYDKTSNYEGTINTELNAVSDEENFCEKDKGSNFDQQDIKNTANQNSKLCDNHGSFFTHPSSQPFNDMKKLLDMLETEISEYEKSLNIRSDPIKIPSTLTGYTANLLSAVIRITRYLKESEVQLRAEMLMRKEILDALEEQRNLIDALTADLIETQEKNEEMKKMIYEQNKTNQNKHFQLSNEFHRLEKKLDSFLMLFDDIFEKVGSVETDHSDVSRDPKDLFNSNTSENNEISPKISPIHF